MIAVNTRVEILIAHNHGAEFVPGSVVAVDPTPTDGEVAPRCDVLTDDGRFWPHTHALSLRRIAIERQA